MASNRERQQAYLQRQRAAGKVAFKAHLDRGALEAFRAAVRGTGADVASVLEAFMLDFVKQGRDHEPARSPRVDASTRKRGPAPASLLGEGDLAPAPAREDAKRLVGRDPGPTQASHQDAGTGAQAARQELEAAPVGTGGRGQAVAGKPKLRKAGGGWLVLLGGRELGRVEKLILSERPASHVWKSHPARGTARVGTHRTRAEAVARLVATA